MLLRLLGILKGTRGDDTPTTVKGVPHHSFTQRKKSRAEFFGDPLPTSSCPGFFGGFWAYLALHLVGNTSYTWPSNRFTQYHFCFVATPNRSKKNKKTDFHQLEGPAVSTHLSPLVFIRLLTYQFTIKMNYSWIGKYTTTV